LLEFAMPFSTKLVDRQNREQNSDAYLHLNSNALIPVFETQDSITFETATILLWLVDRHGELTPSVQDIERVCVLKWLFWLLNALHPSMRMLLYLEKHIDGQTALTQALRQSQKHTFFSVLDMFKDTLSTEPLFGISTPPNIIQQYLTVCLRWLALYPMQETEWLGMGHWPRLRDLCHFLETRLRVTQATLAEGLGQIMLRNSPYKIPPQGLTT
jgi:glutathione S-transferase